MPETADRIESLFAAAVALPPEERDVFLDRECPGDAALRDRILALLRAHERAGHVIDRPVDRNPDQTAGYAPMNEQPGTVTAGRYKLLQQIGEGGMGIAGTIWPARCGGALTLRDLSDPVGRGRRSPAGVEVGR